MSNNNNGDDEKIIFISVASFRDRNCLQTIRDALKKADFPSRLRFGIVHQNDPDDTKELCVDDTVLRNRTDQFRIINMHESEARGPAIARYHASTLIEDGDHYFMQIDSHSLFVRGWDSRVIQMFERAKTQHNKTKIVLSHYPPAWEDMEDAEATPEKLYTTQICSFLYNKQSNLPSQNGAQMVATREELVAVPFIGSGFVFGDIQSVKDVPFDPSLEDLFIGEEISHAARLYTNGYDILSPNRPVVFHYYVRSEEPHYWDKRRPDPAKAEQFVRELLNGEHVGEQYGLGTERSIANYLEFAGIDLKEGRFTKNFCQHDAEPVSFSTEAYLKGTKQKTIIANNTMYILCLALAMGLATVLYTNRKRLPV